MSKFDFKIPKKKLSPANFTDGAPQKLSTTLDMQGGKGKSTPGLLNITDWVGNITDGTPQQKVHLLTGKGTSVKLTVAKTAKGDFFLRLED